MVLWAVCDAIHFLEETHTDVWRPGNLNDWVGGKIFLTQGSDFMSGLYCKPSNCRNLNYPD